MFRPEKFVSRADAHSSELPTFTRVESVTVKGAKTRTIAPAMLHTLPVNWQAPYIEFRTPFWDDMKPQTLAEQSHFEDFVFSHFLLRQIQAWEVVAMEQMISIKPGEFNEELMENMFRASKYTDALMSRASAAHNEFSRLKRSRSKSVEPCDFALKNL